MQVELLVTKECPSCEKAAKVWRIVCREWGVGFYALNVAEPDGRALFKRWRLKSLPALIIDGELMAVGVQSREQAIDLIVIAETT